MELTETKVIKEFFLKIRKQSLYSLRGGNP